MNMRITSTLLALSLTVIVFTGCSNNTTSKATSTQNTQNTTIEKKIVKPTKTDILGGWQATDNSGVMLFDNDKQNTVSFMLNGYKTPIVSLFDIVENDTSYKLNYYDIIVKADTNGGVQQGRQIGTMLVSFKDKNTMQVAFIGEAKIYELKRVDTSIIKSLMGL